jgi:hypothetical protein
MSLPWPSFWQHIRVDDRPAISDILTELLAHGALIGDSGRDRELFLLAREHQQDLGEYFAPLHLVLEVDPDRPILQLRPVPGDCGLLARFSRAETLLVLTLWRIYHDIRMDRPVETVVVTANDIWQRLKLYFEHVEPPREAQLRDMLITLRRRRLVRVQWPEDPGRFGESQIEILPTLPRTIPFENTAAWEEQTALYQPAPTDRSDPSDPSEPSEEPTA